MNSIIEELRRLSPERQDYLLQTLATHLADAGELQRLNILLTDLEYVQAKSGSGLIYGLMRDYMRVLEHDGLRDDARTMINQFARFVGTQAHILSQRPYLVVQQAINQVEQAALEHAALRLRRIKFRSAFQPRGVSMCVSTVARKA
jgi:hypothetical protein